MGGALIHAGWRLPAIEAASRTKASVALAHAAVLAGCLFWPSAAYASDLHASNWSALAVDRVAHGVGDVLTVVVYESSAASNSASTSATRNMSLGGHVSAGSGLNESASLGLDGSSEHAGATGRSGGIVAQITVAIDEVLPNGDLRVSGEQTLNINDERTKIRVKGRVRATDISAGNVVLSSRLADAEIDYDGEGFVSRSATPGIVTRIFTWLGIP
jgi:flagellar L-ring protein precursor FlgH